MSADRLHRGTADPRTPRATLWAFALGALREPRLPRPRLVRMEPVRRTWIGAAWHARIALQAGVSLDDYLRSRLARYLAALPVSRARLPLAVEIEDGQLAVRTAPSPAPPASPPVAVAAEDAWLAPLVAVDGPPARREVSELEVRLVTLDGELERARQRVDERGRQLAADVAVGLVAGPPDVEATAEQLGRPPVRSGAVRGTALAFAAAALAAETWQVALPLLPAMGLAPGALREEAVRSPAEVTLAAVFSLAVATSLFALAHAAVDAAVTLFRGDADDRRRRWLASAALATGGAAALVAAAVAALRPRDAPPLPAPALVLLLLAVPLSAVLALRGSRRDAEGRAADLAAALAWDRERARTLAERARRLEELTWAEDEVRALEARREAARARLRALHARAVEAARLAADCERRGVEELSRLARSLVAALELDRYEFVRQASARGAHELLAPRRRKAPETAPAPVAVAVGVVAEGAAGPAGRIAS
jgi:hypothetical protein